MKIIINLLLMGIIIKTTKCHESCWEDFCSPLWERARVDEPEVESVLIGEDQESGCTCREIPGRYSLCFSRDKKCISFPKKVNISTDTFMLKSTHIREIKPNDLVKVLHVKFLKIENNFNLTSILSGSFRNMKELRNLSISFNTNLRILAKGCFDALVNLETLYLVKNGFVQLSEVTVALTNLPKLMKLDLSENSFPLIKEDDFETLRVSCLKELHLVLCQIEDIEPKAFNPLRNLTDLNLKENNFIPSTITEVIKETIYKVPLKTLNLSSTGLRKSSSRDLLTAISKTNIINLCLAKNQFEVISAQTFPKMPYLQVLDLKQMLILNITDDAFLGFPNLRSLILSGNKLASIPKGALLEQLTHLDLQKNTGEGPSKSSFALGEELFKYMKNLKRLSLSFNELDALNNLSFIGLKNLKILELKNSTIYRISNGTFAPLSNLLLLNLENNLFIKYHPSVLEQGIFHGLDNLLVLLLGSCRISFITKGHITFKDLRKLEHLGLENNKLMTLPSFEVLVKLKSIDLYGNGLQPWKISVFQKNCHLQDVRLSDNKFTYLTNAMIEDFQNLTNLDLRNNPFTCDCSLSWNDQKVIKLIENQSLFCAFPDATTSQTVQQFLHDSNCQNLALVISLVIMISLLAATALSLYYFRWHLRYWIFLTKLHLSRNRKIKNTSETTGYTNYVYDAFVSYSSEDRNFVIRLVTMLENYPPYIKLCVYERDFEIGTIISENVLESVGKSRKTLLVISNSYAKSQWCRWESQIAEHHRLFLQNDNGEYVDDSLILIRLGPVNEAHMTPTLKYLLKTRIYLQWDGDERKQKVFWEKLRETLAPCEEINDNTYM